MEFRLEARDLDRARGATPLYRQIADRIQHAIEAGELRPGDSLPSEPEAASILRVSREVVRDGLDELARDGLIVKRKGAPTRVAEPPPRRRMDASRYLHELEILETGGEHPATSAFVHQHGAKWEDLTIDADYRREKATPTDTEYLGVEVGTPVIRRNLVKYLWGEPEQIQRSAVPYDIAKGTILADPRAQPVPGGTLAELYAVMGGRPRIVAEHIWARMPTGKERRQLQMETPAPVWDWLRVFWYGDRPVEASRVICPCSKNVLYYETDLSG